MRWFAFRIPGCRDFKERQRARQIVEEDSRKKYSLLWSYDAELRRASSGNSFKVNINFQTPGFQPWFKSYYI